MLGDFSDGNLLGVAAHNFLGSLGDTGTRCDPTLDGKDAYGVFQTVWEALYGDVEGDLSWSDTLALSQRYGKFDLLTNWSEAFDKAPHVVLLEAAGHQRLVWGEPGKPGAVKEVRLRRGGYERVVRRFVKWYYEAERTREPRRGRRFSGNEGVG